MKISHIMALSEDTSILSLDNQTDEHTSDVVNVDTMYTLYNKETKTTSPNITKYERAKILGVRAEQLNNNAVANVDVPKHITNVRKIAELEFYQKKIPFMIRRRLPDGTYEHWRLSDFKNL